MERREGHTYSLSRDIKLGESLLRFDCFRILILETA